MLTRAVEATSLAETQRIVSEIRLERLTKDMADAKKVALRTSGQRGKRARDEEIKAEERVREATEASVSVCAAFGMHAEDLLSAGCRICPLRTT